MTNRLWSENDTPKVFGQSPTEPHRTPYDPRPSLKVTSKHVGFMGKQYWPSARFRLVWPILFPYKSHMF
jgi:hypothetical protein